MPRERTVQRVFPATDQHGRPRKVIAIEVWAAHPGSGPAGEAMLSGRLLDDKGEPLIPLKDDNGQRVKGKYQSATGSEILTSTDPDAP